MKQVSKLRNIFGEPKKEKFTDIAMEEVTSEGSLIAVNSTFLGVSWQSVKGCVGIFDANVPTRIQSEIHSLEDMTPISPTLNSVPSGLIFYHRIGRYNSQTLGNSPGRRQGGHHQ